MKIIMLGPQGSGKGTQAQILSKRTGILHISTGDLLRDIALSGSETGQEVKRIINSGSLIPDDLMIKILMERLEEKDAKFGFVLDGFPRTLAQSRALDKLTRVDAVFYIQISDKEAIKRLSGRTQCRDCKQVYGIRNPPVEENVCDSCHGELFQRGDDKPEAIKKRLLHFHEEIKPLLEHYKSRLHYIDGENDIEKIAEDVRDLFKELSIKK